MKILRRAIRKRVDRVNRLMDRIVASFDGMHFRKFNGTVDRYDEFAGLLLVEPTWYQGLGLGIGLGKYDFWVGWPRDRFLTAV